MRHDTRDAVVLTFAVPESSQADFRFTQGQYLSLRTTLGGEEIRRNYSICSAAGDALRVGIKRVPGGLFSTWAKENVLPGQSIDAMPPLGNFNLPLNAAAKRHYLGIAAGSGITPLLSLIKTTLQTEAQSRFTLIYGNRASSTTMFREELEDLKNTYLSRFNPVFLMSREQQEIELFNGRITQEKCAALFRQWVDVSGVDAAFVCGPEDMMNAAAAALLSAGLEKAKIKRERFTPGKRAATAAIRQREATTGRRDVTIIIDGRSNHFSIPKDGLPLLEAIMLQGLELPHSCKGGICSTCRAKLIEGEVDMDINFALEDYEVARGVILCCQSYPATDKLVIDFDQPD